MRYGAVWTLAIFAAATAWSIAASAGGSGMPMEGMGHEKGHTEHMQCPMHVSGAKVEVKNISGGVRIEITAPDTATVKTIRDRANKMKKMSVSNRASAAPYSCPMHPEAVSDKPGNCPECGMRLEKK